MASNPLDAGESSLQIGDLEMSFGREGRDRFQGIGGSGWSVASRPGRFGLPDRTLSRWHRLSHHLVRSRIRD